MQPLVDPGPDPQVLWVEPSPLLLLAVLVDQVSGDRTAFVQDKVAVADGRNVVLGIDLK